MNPSSAARCGQLVNSIHSAERPSQQVRIPLQMPFFNAQMWEEKRAKLLGKACTDEEREEIRKFCAKSPFDLAAIKEWRQEERVPESLRQMIKTPVDELEVRLEMFLQCIEPSFFKSISDYLSDPYAMKVFEGVSIMVDQSNSSADQKGSDPDTIKKTTEMMHLYFLCSIAVFRLMRDVLVGDAISLDGKAPEDNPSLVAVEGARFLLTMKGIFEIHNKLVDMCPKGLYNHIRIRGAMGVGTVGINDNKIQPTVICDLMNFVSRISGYPPEMGVLANERAGAYLQPYFRLKETRVGEELVKLIDALKQECRQGWERRDGLSEKELVSLYGKYFALVSVLNIMHISFERKNISDGEAKNGENGDGMLQKLWKRLGDFWNEAKERLAGENRWLGEKRECRRELRALGSFMYSKFGARLDNQLSDVEDEVEFVLGAQPFIQFLGKFKGFRYEDIGTLWEIVQYKTFAEDELASPENCLFRKIFLEVEGEGRARGKSLIELMVEDTGEKYAFPTRTNFNPEVAYYMMYTMQLTGSPDFAFQTSARAAGIAIYMIDGIRENFGKQPNSYLENVEKALAARGVFGKDGEIDSGKLNDYLERAVILPALVNEIGILELFNEVNREQLEAAVPLRERQLESIRNMMDEPGNELGGANSNEQKVRELILRLNGKVSALEDKSKQLERISAWLATPFGEFTSEEDVRIRDLIRESNKLSARMLARLNEAYGQGAVPEETIKVVSRMAFDKPIIGAEGEEELLYDLALATDIVRMSRMVQAMRKKKAHRRDQKPLPWETIRRQLRKSEIDWNVLAAYDDLFIMPHS